MHVLHSAKRVLAAAALAALAAGCGKDSNAPEAPFDPAGTSSDVSAVAASFDSPALASFEQAADEIALTANSDALALQVRPSVMLATGGKAAALRYAASVAKAYIKPGSRPSLAVAQADISPDLLGTTFVYDVSVQHYAASDLTGAPANGVRFLLYAVNPVTGSPVEPLVEVGYADVVTTQTTSSASTSIVVVSENVTYLDYSATVSATSQTAGVVTVSGYVTNGEDRVNFDLETALRFTSTGTELNADYLLTVPTRGGFRIDLELTATLPTSGQIAPSPTLTLDLTARGPHGTVNIAGSTTSGSGSFQVRVDGDLFATIEVSAEGDPVVTGANGEALTPDEQAALEDVFSLFAGGLDFFEALRASLAA